MSWEPLEGQRTCSPYSTAAGASNSSRAGPHINRQSLKIHDVNARAVCSDPAKSSYFQERSCSQVFQLFSFLFPFQFSFLAKNFLHLQWRAKAQAMSVVRRRATVGTKQWDWVRADSNLSYSRSRSTHNARFPEAQELPTETQHDFMSEPLVFSKYWVELELIASSQNSHSLLYPNMDTAKTKPSQIGLRHPNLK